MFSQAAQELLSQPATAIVAVNRPSSGPQVTPVWYLLDGEALYFSTTKDRAKYSNIKRNPSISLIVENHQGFSYVAVYGKATFIDHDEPEFVRLTTLLISKYMPPDQREQMLKDSLGSNRVLVKLQPEKVVGPGGGD